jgi:hypothetical protein
MSGDRSVCPSRDAAPVPPSIWLSRHEAPAPPSEHLPDPQGLCAQGADARQTEELVLGCMHFRTLYGGHTQDPIPMMLCSPVSGISSVAGRPEPSLRPIGYTWSCLACRIGHWVSNRVLIPTADAARCCLAWAVVAGLKLCRIGHWVPNWQAIIGSSFRLLTLLGVAWLGQSWLDLNYAVGCMAVVVYVSRLSQSRMTDFPGVAR